MDGILLVVEEVKLIDEVCNVVDYLLHYIINVLEHSQHTSYHHLTLSVLQLLVFLVMKITQFTIDGHLI